MLSVTVRGEIRLGFGLALCQGVEMTKTPLLLTFLFDSGTLGNCTLEWKGVTPSDVSFCTLPEVAGRGECLESRTSSNAKLKAQVRN